MSLHYALPQTYQNRQDYLQGEHMQTIIGSRGAIGIPLAKELRKYTTDIRLVSRDPKKSNEQDELFPLEWRMQIQGRSSQKEFEVIKI
ncbi:MAG TPA: hypothetical protein VI385_17925 [Flavisolibacter sp.]